MPSKSGDLPTAEAKWLPSCLPFDVTGGHGDETEFCITREFPARVGSRVASNGEPALYVTHSIPAHRLYDDEQSTGRSCVSRFESNGSDGSFGGCPLSSPFAGARWMPISFGFIGRQGPHVECSRQRPLRARQRVFER